MRNRPDSTVWMRAKGYNEPLAFYYHNHPAYMNYPIVGINQKQAEAYCNWLRDRLLETFKWRKVPIEDIIVRLPSTSEWEYAARGGLGLTAIYPWKGENIRITPEDGLRKKDLGKLRINTKSSLGDMNETEAGFQATPVYSYWPNGYDLYNMSGNVAEWVRETNKTKGGSYLLPAYYSRIDVTGKYDGDSSARCDVGFRYVVEIVKTSSPGLKPFKLNAKSTEAMFRYVDTSLIAAETEVSNSLYRKFIYETDGSAKPNDTLWLPYTKYHHFLMYSSHPAFDNYPAVNIRYEDAVNFCKWLTEKYNAFPDRKYKQVEFRLPSAAEWLKAARAGRVGNMYPWGGPFLRNSRGLYLANFFPKPEQSIIIDSAGNYGLGSFDSSEARKLDGLEFTGMADSYFPNDFGLYCVSGNAAEMIKEKGKTLGGSWNSDAYYLSVNLNMYNEYRTESYTGPSPMVGFRIFMEIKKK